MYYFDLNYLLIMAIPIMFSMYASYRVKSAYKKAGQIKSTNGMTGKEIAKKILEVHGVQGVGIEESNRGVCSDHYDPKAKVLRLSPEVYHTSSLAAQGIAAHEVGHAIQDAQKYAPLVLRNGIVPLSSFGGNISMWVMMIGVMLSMQPLILLGAAFFSLVVIFTLITLPVEFNASSRAKDALTQYGLISSRERKEISGVLNAAAMTYVAAAISSIVTLLYYLMRSGVLSGGDD